MLYTSIGIRIGHLKPPHPPNPKNHKICSHFNPSLRVKLVEKDGLKRLINEVFVTLFVYNFVCRAILYVVLVFAKGPNSM